ncbi:AraC-type DNA-binding protein [Hymenobacter daecheongensis DSM 21074]|uniref:AraC-type DNA-binding protein n=1 Tax=Hymenobacter daecheongensis DSM 21074 TaxID=1121955 RepID=A0A1M6ER06_9BACT|nr:helix-turn-helix transcriptional regulator [Hymenobacter daecheongensis]SHI87749.1 AraC-type DNA-binding protein [Hymenobacter daecheongensis DSM 21074]
MFFGFNVYSGLLLPFFVQGMVVSGVLWVRRRREEAAADGWLALLLLLFTMRLAQWMLGFGGWYDAHDARTTFMFYWPFSNWLAVGPALYFYFRSLTNQEFRLQRRQWLHFAPALAWAIWLLLLFSYDIGWWHGVRGLPLPEHFGTKGPLAAWADQQPIGFWVDTLGYLSVLTYAVRTLREYRAYARYLNDNFSATDQIRFRWLRNVLVAVLVGTGITLIFGLINTFISALSYYEAWYDYLFTGLLIYYLSIAGLLTGHRLAGLRFQPAPEIADRPQAQEAPAFLESVAAAIPVPAVPPTPETSAPEKTTASVAGEAEAVEPAAIAAPEASAELARWTTRLLRHLETERPYLAPELTLGELAAQLRTNTSWLSRVINTGCGQNFNDFINEYRVREAEQRLRDPRFRHYTLLAVALEAGFNSKSTFNRVFKKLRGSTPSQVAREG